jgi:hypothetical protein
MDRLVIVCCFLGRKIFWPLAFKSRKLQKLFTAEVKFQAHYPMYRMQCQQDLLYIVNLHKSLWIVH